MDILDPLITYKNHTGLSNSQFADKAGIPRPTLSQFLNGRNKRLSDDLTAKLHQAYPDLNVMWLLFGEGDMLMDSNIEISEGIIGREESNQTISVAEYEEPAQYGGIFSAIDEPEQSTQPAYTQPNIEPKKFPQQENPFAETPVQPITAAPTPAQITAAETTKKIQSIMVFYTDNSYELFTPSVGDQKK